MQAKRHRLDWMFDKLQFVEDSKRIRTAENDKLKFIGHESVVGAVLCRRSPKENK